MEFIHVNLISENWKNLAKFYINVFNCEPVLPERDLTGDWVDRATGLKDAHIRGIHLKLPGNYSGNPTLEIFQYNIDSGYEHSKKPNSLGYAHIAFKVNDFEKVKKEIIKAGGGIIGEVVKTNIPGTGEIKFAYMTDPEGNIIEIQKQL